MPEQVGRFTAARGFALRAALGAAGAEPGTVAEGAGEAAALALGRRTLTREVLTRAAVVRLAAALGSLRTAAPLSRAGSAARGPAPAPTWPR